MTTPSILQSVCQAAIFEDELNFDRKSQKIGFEIKKITDKRAEIGRKLEQEARSKR